MSVICRLLVLVSALSCGGCRHFHVGDAELDRYWSLPRAERKHAVVAATRDRDGAPVLIRASEALPERETNGDRRRVRVFRPLTVTGLVFVATGLSFAAAGIALWLAPHNCNAAAKPEDCDARYLVSGLAMLSAGGVELPLGIILASVGASSAELPSVRPPLFEIRLP